MKHFLLLLLLICFASQAFPQKYVKIWGDEFNTPGLPDSTKWTYEVGKLRNNELQYYTAKRLENARIQDTVLIIEARKEAYQGAAYTSASLISKYKGDWQYGKFEIRAKIPTGKGTWPAIWMMPTDAEYGGWPKSGEMDLMENVGFDPNHLYFTAHFEGTNGTGHQSSGTSVLTTQPYNRFITYAFVWTPTKIEWYADDHLFFTYSKIASDPRVWPFDKMFYMILNLAYGGSWGAQQGIDDTLLPHKFLIDYVRVYQLQESTGPFSLTIQPATGGTVDVSPKLDSYPEGTTVTLTAKPDNNYEFDKWLHVSSANPVTIDVSKNTNLIPVFKKKNELIKNGDFSQGLNNWNNLYFYSTNQAATPSVVNGEYVINITRPGTANWHIDDQQLGIPLVKGATYQVTFDAHADKAGSMDVFISKNYGDYGGYYSTVKSVTTTPQKFSWTFTMAQASDPNCRFGFGFGTFTGKVYLDNVSVEKIATTGLEPLAKPFVESFGLFPNPTEGYFEITNQSGKTLEPTVSLFNLQGQIISTLWDAKPMTDGEHITVNPGGNKVGAGIYLLRISTPGTSVTKKIVINKPDQK